MSDFVGVDVKAEIDGMDEVKRLLANATKPIRDAVVEDVSDYMINAFQQQPPPKHVSRKVAYPEVDGWFSERQRKFVMAAIRAGRIRTPYQRTQGMRKAWKKLGAGEDLIIVNEAPGAPFVMGPGTQARQPALVGWQTTDAIIKQREKRITSIAAAAAKKALKAMEKGK